MTAEGNKELLRHVFSETARGNGRPFVDTLADDVRWTIVGTTAWARTYQGKRAVLEELLGPLAAQFTGPNTVSAERFVAEGDLVVIEARNHSTTLAGDRYPNRYCWIMRMRDGKIAEITEYTDTQLINDVLTPPAQSEDTP
ncbi:nuclear transport factor 2 family protein [Nonomuraea sp. NPDC050536]|uniref:nuclear transport factor 2 family protein n=1 Tax=Nonomuraea sp. NPDC050536 TaxID=3364366 RepID=UPI0037C74324